MANKFREYTPKYSDLKREFKNYQTYKKYLIKDFHHRCGYCHDHDMFFGGQRNYQIDHFAPKARFEDLINKYHNLVYSCPFCNRYKSNKWVGKTPDENIKDNKGFIHPCNIDYEKHFIRNDRLEIIPTDEIGQYMYEELHLYLKRHSIINFLDKLNVRVLILNDMRERNNLNIEYSDLQEITNILMSYIKYLNILAEE